MAPFRPRSSQDDPVAVDRRWLLLHVATLAAIAVTLVLCVRGQWFFGDEWDFLVFRGLHHAARSVWQPHNEHWSTLPILWYRAVFSVVGLKSYWPYLSGLFVVHLAAVHALWRLARRTGVPPLLATAGVCVFGLFGWGSENLLWAFQIAFVASLAAGLYLQLALDDHGSPRRVVAVASGAVVSLMLSGISVVMVLALGIAALGRWGWRKAALATAPAAVTYLLWLSGPGGNGIDTKNSNRVGDIPSYVWGGFRAALGEPLHSRFAGGIVALVLGAVFLARLPANWRRAPEVVALAVVAVVMYAVISQGRGAVQAPDVSRYRYLAVALVLPFILRSLADIARPRIVEMLAVAGALIFVATGTAQLRTNARTDSLVKLGLREQLLASIHVAAHEETLSNNPDPNYGSGINVAQLRRLRDRGNLPAWHRSARSIAAARLALEVAVSPTHASTAAPCVNADAERPMVEVGPHRGRWVTVVRATDQAIVQLFLPYDGGNAGPRITVMAAGDSARVVSLLRGPLLVRVVSGAARVCGPGASA